MKISVLRKLLSFIISIILVFSLAVISSAKIVILDSWLPFDVWTGNGTASVTLGDNYMTGDIQEYVKAEDFSELISRHPDIVITENDYTVSTVDGVTVITLNEAYLKALDDDAYYFFAEFRDAQIPVVLYVVTEKVTVNTVLEFRDWSWNEEGDPMVVFSSYGSDVFFSPVLFESVSYKGEKLDSSFYSVSSFAGAVSLSISKDFLRTLPSGTHYFQAEFLNAGGITLKIDIPPVYTLGDYNGDGKVSAADARDVLRAAAKLENTVESKIFIADIDTDGRLTAGDARRILRVGAKVESLNVITVELSKNEVFETPVMTNNVMYQWVCDMPENSRLVCEKSDNIPNSDPFLIGGGTQRFTFSSEHAGVYTARFKYVVGWESDSTPADELFYIITVK